MAKKKTGTDIVYVGVDCGLKGGITVIEGDKVNAYRMPVKAVKKTTGTKNKYDLDAIVDILESYTGRNVICLVERQGVRPGEGSVSSMTIGEGYGQLQGIAKGMRFRLEIVSPQTWKKSFSKLDSEDIRKKRDELKEMKEQYKNIKDNKLKKENKKEIGRIEKEIKNLAKTQARLIVADLYPELADKVSKKCEDGVAESVLIALYARTLYK
jgi:hypothetical protein